MKEEAYLAILLSKFRHLYRHDEWHRFDRSASRIIALYLDGECLCATPPSSELSASRFRFLPTPKRARLRQAPSRLPKFANCSTPQKPPPRPRVRMSITAASCRI